jgi:hypothetical protein
MGRELRRVPADWQHPKDKKGHYIPMDDHFPYNKEEIQEGLRDGWLKNEPPNYGVPVMPQWPDSERTHYQMYEDTSEGTPISPVMETPEALARWLADHKASAFAGMTATYEHWLATIKRGSSVGMAFSPKTGFISGVEFEGGHQSKG